MVDVQDLKLLSLWRFRCFRNPVRVGVCGHIPCFSSLVFFPIKGSPICRYGDEFFQQNQRGMNKLFCICQWSECLHGIESLLQEFLNRPSEHLCTLGDDLA